MPLIPKEKCEALTMYFDSLMAEKSGLGTAGIVVINKDQDIILTGFCDHFGIILASFWDNVGINLTLFWCGLDVRCSMFGCSMFDVMFGQVDVVLCQCWIFFVSIRRSVRPKFC